jgi:carnitine O-palmitoyltransferase 1
MVQKLIPLCSSQYERQFNTVRIPGKEAGRFNPHFSTLVIIYSLFLDKIVHYADSYHIAVYHKGRWFKVFMFYKHSLLHPCEVQMYIFIIDLILNIKCEFLVN